MINAGLLPGSAASSVKRKFTIYNTDLTVLYIRFVELTFQDATTNALFFPYFGAYKWVSVSGCVFELRQQLVMTQEGVNVNISSSVIDISKINRVTIYQSMSQCALYQKSGIANNQIWNNNTFIGVNSGGYTALIYTQNHCNMTMTNNQFIDTVWINSQISINFEHVAFKCPIPPYTKIQIENNTVKNTGELPILSYIYFTMNFNEDGFQEAVIKNNKFENVQYISPGFFQLKKTKSINFTIAFENNVFNKVFNVIESWPLALLHAPIVSVKNVSLTNSESAQFIDLSTSQATISNVTFENVTGFGKTISSIYYSTLALASLNSAILQIDTSSNVAVTNISFAKCNFMTARALNVLSTSQINITQLSISDSNADQNHLVYLSETRDLQMSSVNISQVRKNQPTSAAALQIDLVSPWSDPNRQFYYKFTDWSFRDSQLQFFEFGSILLNPEAASNGPILIEFKTLNITNITLRDKTNLFHVNTFAYDKLDIKCLLCNIQNSTVDLGAFVYLQYSSRSFWVENILFRSNQGQMLILEPPEIPGLQYSLTATMLQGNFSNNSASLALLYVSKGTNFTIKNSSFIDNYSTDRGSIIFAENLNSHTFIQNSQFSSNYALLGGVFFTQLNGMIQCLSCNITKNFALYGGVLYSQNEGQASFVNSTLEQNQAVKAGLIYSINSQSQILVQSGKIQRNGLVSKQGGIDIRRVLCFENRVQSQQLLAQNFSQSYINALESYLDMIKTMMSYGSSTPYDQIENYQFQMIKSTILFNGDIIVQNQISFLSAQSASIANINGLIYSNTIVSGALIETDQAMMQISGLSMSNIQTNSPIFVFLSDSQIDFANLTINSMNGPILLSDNSQLTVKRSHFVKVADSGSGFPIFEMLKSTIKWESVFLSEFSLMTNEQSLTKPIVYLKADTDVLFNNVTAQYFDNQFMKVEDKSSIHLSNSTIQHANNTHRTSQSGTAISMLTSSAFISNCTFKNLTSKTGSALHAIDLPQTSYQQMVTVQNCSFFQNKGEEQGGSILFKDLNGYISKSVFDSSITKTGNGGSVFLSCSITSNLKCDFSVQNNTFQNNAAGENGGAIYYDLYSPNGLQENNFANNTAKYGNNYASYPFQLKQVVINQATGQTSIASMAASQDSALVELVSGRIFNGEFTVGVYDQNDQLVSTDYSSEGIMTSNDIKVQISGNNKLVAKKGIYSFTNLKFVAAPDYRSFVKFVSGALDNQKITRITSKPFEDFQLPVYFRKCVTGEVIQNNMCVGCNRGYYSFNSTSLQCNKCFQYGICNGTNETEVSPGYWRSSLTSIQAFQCPERDSCLGGRDSTCAVGYEGKMCNLCYKGADEEGNYYARSGPYSCTKCNPLSLQLFMLFAVCLAMAAYIVYLMYSVLSNPSRNKPQTVLIRIITNYSQAILIVLEFNLNWPTQVQQSLQYFSAVSSAQEYVFSFDCIYKQTGLTLNVPTIYIEVIKYGLMPVVFSGLAAIIWYLIGWYRESRHGHLINLRQNIQVTTFVIIYLIYPSISNLSFSLFNCFQLDDGNSYLRRDFSIQCWVGNHRRMALAIGLTFIFVWVIGFPAFIFYKLYQNRRQFQNRDFILRYGLFFVGLSDGAYFWEVIITNSRKIVFVICSTLLSTVDPFIKAIIGVLAMFIQMQLLHQFVPYIDPRFDQIEHLGIYASILTVFTGIFFMQDEVQQNNNSMFFLFLLVLGVNIYFLLMWGFRFMDVIFRTYMNKFRHWSICKCLKHRDVIDYESDLRRIISNHQGSSSSFSRRFVKSRSQSGMEIDLSYSSYILPQDKSISMLDKDSSAVESSFHKSSEKQTVSHGNNRDVVRKKIKEHNADRSKQEREGDERRKNHPQKKGAAKEQSIFSTPEIAFNESKANFNQHGRKTNDNIWEQSASLNMKRTSSKGGKHKVLIEPLKLEKIKNPYQQDKGYTPLPKATSPVKNESKVALTQPLNKKVSKEMSKKSSSYNYPNKQEHTFNPGEYQQQSPQPVMIFINSEAVSEGVSHGNKKQAAAAASAQQKSQMRKDVKVEQSEQFTTPQFKYLVQKQEQQQSADKGQDKDRRGSSQGNRKNGSQPPTKKNDFFPQQQKVKDVTYNKENDYDDYYGEEEVQEGQRNQQQESISSLEHSEEKDYGRNHYPSKNGDKSAPQQQQQHRDRETKPGKEHYQKSQKKEDDPVKSDFGEKSNHHNLRQQNEDRGASNAKQSDASRDGRKKNSTDSNFQRQYTKSQSKQNRRD